MTEALIHVGHLWAAPLLHKYTGRDRLWSRVAVRGQDECWEWTGPPNLHGYGVVLIERRPRHAHILAYELAGGSVPVGAHIHHRCENKLCCNPAHLEALSPSEHALCHNQTRCPHGLNCRACRVCDRDRKRLERAQLTPEEREDRRRRDRDRKRAKRSRPTAQ